jgi:hypothetical protein
VGYSGRMNLDSESRAVTAMLLFFALVALALLLA